MGDDAGRARRVIVEVLRQADTGQDASLLGGWAGLSLLHGYASRAKLAPVDTGTTRDRVDHTLDLLAAQALDPWLGGTAGVAWAVAHLERQKMIPTVRGRFQDLDRTLPRLLRSSQRLPVELVYGVAGLAVYAIERLPHASARPLLDGVLRRLVAAAEADPDGLAWASPWPRRWARGGRRRPERYFDLGVAHGVPGVIGAIGAMSVAGVERRRAAAILTPAVEWLLARRLPAAGKRPLYPALWIAGATAEPARTAWCYGDPGVAMALLLAARATGRADWARAAIAIGLAAARRPAAACGVVDASLCHGSAGLAHLFSRLYRLTGLEAFETAARRWFRDTLRRRRPGEGIAGYVMLQPVAQGDALRPVAESGLLNGAAGVALALLGAVSATEPCWDRCLLLSARTPR